MRLRRLTAGLSSLAVASALLASVPVAQATPSAGTSDGAAISDAGRGPATAARAVPGPRARVATSAAATAVPDARDPLTMPTSYPFQPRLDFFRDNPTGPNGEADFNTEVPGLVSHPDIAPFLTDLMARSDRVSTQVIGRSTQGRDLYLVTVTAPETEEFTAQQTAWRDTIRNNPTAAAADANLLSQYKTPIWISNNIHGNEWEGTDAALDYIEYLATAPLSEVGSILRNNRIYFSPSLNPDGRTNATRATALGFDPNRDMITLTNPEAASYVRTADAIQAMYAADFHGYTQVLQMEPTGPPHGSNYEYDLYIPHNYALALAVEDAVTDPDNLIPGNTYLTGRRGSVTSTPTEFIKIPYRDTPDGWDDFPPIFTAQYAAFYGAITSTVELPLGRNRNASNTGSGNVLINEERATINTAVARRTMEAIVDYMNDAANARDLLRNQIETFRRGVAGEPKTALTTENIADVPGPSQWKEEWDVADDQEPVQLPRAYVIPVGDTQRSASDARFLAQRLIDVGLEVGTLNAPATVDGVTYPAGSYVVDMHQPLRGLANALLDLGEDISAKVPSMYDISAWSLGYLWGADVAKVGDVTDQAIGATTRITSVPAAPALPAAGSYLTFDLAGVADYAAVNDLLRDGVAVTMIEDGSVVVAPGDRAAVAAAVAKHGITVSRATDADLAALEAPSAKGLSSPTIAYTGNQDDRVSLQQLGFTDLRQITAAGVNGDPSILDGVDVIWVGAAFSFNDSLATGRLAIQEWLDEGGAMLGRGTAGFNAAAAFGLVQAVPVSGNNSGNGIVAVDTPEDSVLAPYAQDHSFVYPALSFITLGGTTKAEQTYAAGNPLLAGHWRPTNANPLTTGPEAAGGNASVISGTAASGAKAMVFGTSVFFRTHPRGGLTQAARGLMWAAPAGPAVTPPPPPPPPVVKVNSRTFLQVSRVPGRPLRARLNVRVTAPGRVPTGELAIRKNGSLLRVARLRAGDQGTRVLTVRLNRGRNTLRVVYRGNDQIRLSRSPVRAVRVS